MAIVTLTTDFATADGYVGAMKGVILGRAPSAQLVDLTHEIERHDIEAAAFALATAAPLFPAGTIHVAVVDPGVGGRRLPVVVCSGGQVFVGPDNGIFALAAPLPEAAYEIAADRFVRHPISDTFHGRDVFAAAAGVLAAGLEPAEAGPPIALEIGPSPKANLSRGPLVGEINPSPQANLIGGPLVGEVISREAADPCIVHIDRFGNLITDIPGDELGPDDAVAIAGGPPIVQARTYADAPVGGVLAYVGSAGTVEIAVREGSAAEVLGAARGDGVAVIRGVGRG
jgi:hypothetical protein